ncbi:aldo/keto reductase [uncultured Sphingomonas sp.]|uniref:aldo/keto reductase n=1 Tax=uncultured Sphingomonas sp. TaxID=158754 RepID=UPI0034555D5C
MGRRQVRRSLKTRDPARSQAARHRQCRPYKIHRFNHDVPIEETLEALHDVVKEGQGGYIGASSIAA